MKKTARKVNKIIEKIESAFIKTFLDNNVGCYSAVINYDEGRILEILNYMNELLQDDDIQFIPASITENEAFFEAYNHRYDPIGFAIVVNNERHEVVRTYN